MSDMTAGERAKLIVSQVSGKFNKQGAIWVEAQIRQAEAAARRKALEEAATYIMLKADASDDPDISCFYNLAEGIRALMDNPDDSLVHSASVAKRHVESWREWKQEAMRREVGIKERDRKKWP